MILWGTKNRSHRKNTYLTSNDAQIYHGVSEYLASYLVTKSNCRSLIRYTVIHKKNTIHKLWIGGYRSQVGAISHVHAYGWGANTTWPGYIIAILSGGAGHGKLLGAHRFWRWGSKGVCDAGTAGFSSLSLNLTCFSIGCTSCRWHLFCCRMDPLRVLMMYEQGSSELQRTLVGSHWSLLGS